MGVTHCNDVFVSFAAGTRTPDLPATGHTAGESPTFKDFLKRSSKQAYLHEIFEGIENLCTNLFHQFLTPVKASTSLAISAGPLWRVGKLEQHFAGFGHK